MKTKSKQNDLNNSSAKLLLSLKRIEKKENKKDLSLVCGDSEIWNNKS